MTTNTLTFEKTGYFSSFICDYVSQHQSLKELYHRFPSIKNFKFQIQEKKSHFPTKNREILVNSLKNQYKNIHFSEKTEQNIQKLLSENCFTITTGHQLSLFTGPLYFIYKIVTTINLASTLKAQYPDYEFVPIYWMATEDHDFEEINHFILDDKKVVWNTPQSGMVGDFQTESLTAISQSLQAFFGKNKTAENLISLFTESYCRDKNLAKATRFLVNEIFKEYGLVIVDGNDYDLKQLFIPEIEKDIFQNTAYQQVSQTITKIKNISPSYPAQVTPREINFFYLQKGSRERIIKTDNGFQINNTDVHFSEEELKMELKNFPERFSPNVIMRPVYQEVILPNLCYIGGGGEIAYWLELKSLFNTLNIPFPMLLVRNSVLLIGEKQSEKLTKLKLSFEDIFLKNNDLENKITRKISEIPLDFSPQKEMLSQQFKNLYKIAQETDPTFLNAVKAQEVKQLKGLENLEKRLLKAQKRKYHDILSRSLSLRNELFPNGNLQERTHNFSSYMVATQGKLIDILIENLNPIAMNFSIIRYE